MTSKKPPVPTDNRSPKGTGADPKPCTSDIAEQPETENLDKQGNTAATKQNTGTQAGHGHRTR